MNPEDLMQTTAIAAAERLVRVETKLDHIIANKDREHNALMFDIADHETRIRKLETIWWKAVGAAAVVSGIVAGVAGVVVNNLSGG